MASPAHRAIALIATAAVCAATPSVAVTLEGSAGPEPYIVESTPAAYTDLDNYLGKPEYAAFANQKINWSPDNCMIGFDLPPGEEPNDQTLECAKIKVPMDWHNVSRGTINVGLSRLYRDRDRIDNQRDRLLLTNPGGPGSSGTTLPSYTDMMLKTEKTHASVGVDPRGVNLSTRLECPSVPLPAESHVADGEPRSFTREEVRAHQEWIKTVNQRCAKEVPLARYINSEQTARDLSLVRHVLGYRTADFYGVSYGTWLGSLLTKMFPNQFDRVILDANSGWESGSLSATFRHQTISFQASHDRMLLPFLARHHDKYGLGQTPNEVERTMRWLRRLANEGKLVNAPEAQAIDNEINGGLYHPIGYDRIGQKLASLKADAEGKPSKPEERITAGADLTIAAAQRRNNKSEEYYEGFNPSVFQMLPCADNPDDGDFDQLFTQREALARELPVNGADSLYYACKGWPFAGAVTPELMRRPVKPLLMVHNEADPATGYRLAYQAAKRHPAVRFLTIDDQVGHGTPQTYNTCAMGFVNGFMSTGVLPKGDVNCQAGPINAKMERTIYEFFNPSTPQSVNPRPYLYVMRNLNEPRIDTAATAAWQAENPEGLRRNDDLALSPEQQQKLSDALAQLRSPLPPGARRPSAAERPQR